MTSYYINPFTGSDSNAGTSWGTALKTFFPIENNTIVLAPGDLVKIAKTEDAETPTFNFTGAYLTSYNITGYTDGWTPLFSFGLPAGFSSRIKVVAPWITTTGITAVVGTVYTATHNESYLDPDPALSYGYNESSWVSGGLIFYHALPATVNLSAFGRIEFRMYGYGQNDVGPLEQQWRLCLCSDAAGVTSLLEIPFYPGDNNSSIISYEGTLPNGVNSIAFRFGAVKGGGGSYVITGLIATQAYSSANYFGYFTQLRLGNHEGAIWHPMTSFIETAGVTYMKIVSGNTGPASANTATLSAYLRKSTSWKYYPYQVMGTNYYGTGKNPQNAVHRTLLSPTMGKMRALFNLIDKNGTAGSPIQIVGGYDPNTDTVTGKTALLSRSWPESAYNQTCPLAFANSSYITFKNIDIFSVFLGIYMAAETSHDIRFENCELIGQMTHNASYSRMSTVHYNPGDTRPTLYNLTWKDCIGNFLPYAYYSSDQNYWWGPTYCYNLTLDNCILAAFNGPFHTSYTTNEYAVGISPVTLIGNLKMYCMGGDMYFPTSGSSTMTDGYRMLMPPFVNGTTGTVYIYGGGVVKIWPGVPAGQHGGSYTYPRFELENTVLMFTDGNARYGDVHFGTVGSVTVPYMKVTFTAAGWCGRSMNASYYAAYRTMTMVMVESLSAPIDIQQVVIAGAPYNSSLSVRHYLLTAQLLPVRIANLTAPTPSPVWNFALFCQQRSYTSSPAASYLYPSPFGPAIYTFDGISLTYAATSSQEMFTDIVTNYDIIGIFDVINSTWVNTSTAYSCDWGPYYGAVALHRYINSTITNAQVGDAYCPIPSMPYVKGGSGTQINHMRGWHGDVGIVIKNCTMPVSTTITAYTGLSTSHEWTTYDRAYWANGTTIINTSTPSHVTHWAAMKLEKDFTTYYSAPFSWKSTLRMIATMPFTIAYPITSVPLKAGKTATITLWVRRSNNTDCFGGLIALHNGTAGNSLPTDYQEITAFASGAANVWEMVTLQFVVQQSGLLDLYISHFGNYNTVLWFDDLRIVES